jgi:hypothetical protein
MEKRNNTRNLVITIAILIAFIGAAYFYITRETVSDADLLVGVPIAGTATIDGDLLSTLRELKRLRLDDSIFTMPSFVSLTDQSRPLPPQTSGRINPFAPLESSASVFSTSTPGR